MENILDVNLVAYIMLHIFYSVKKQICVKMLLHICEISNPGLEDTFTQAVYLYMHISRKFSLVLYDSDTTDTPPLL